MTLIGPLVVVIVLGLLLYLVESLPLASPFKRGGAIAGLEAALDDKMNHPSLIIDVRPRWKRLKFAWPLFLVYRRAGLNMLMSLRMTAWTMCWKQPQPRQSE